MDNCWNSILDDILEYIIIKDLSFGVKAFGKIDLPKNEK